MPGKITVRNYTTLTDYAALCRAGRYLAGYQKEAEKGGFRFRVTENERHGVVVKITEVEKVKNGKKPTLAQKKFLQENGLAPEKWMIVKDTPDEMVVISRIALQRNSGKTKTIRKAKK